ncbi:hypothetical protein ACER0C_003025 [Sarotherodon galilaeus]
MARWGVARYGVGYLDYTFARANSVPLFTVLANAVEVAAARFRTLHYRYTRNLAFGDGGFSSSEVNGVYKLEAGMFFRRVSDEPRRVKSFVSIPGVPELEFGLSSDMNVGSTLPISKVTMANAAREMNYIPCGAKTVRINRSGVVVFVDTDKDVICYHVPPTTPGEALRTLPFGVAVKNTERNLLGVGCVQSVPGDRRHTRLAVTLPAWTKTEKETLLENIRLIRRSMSEPVLSLEDTIWLSHAADIEQQRRSVESKGEAGVFAEMHAVSLVLQCLQRSSSCLALANMVENSWPQGGTGYPVDVRAFAVEAGVVLKMIVVANHGALTVTLSCDLKTFAFGSHDTRVNRQGCGYYQRKGRPLLDQVASEIGKIQSVNTRGTTERLCYNETCGDETRSHGGYVMWARDCVSATEQLAAEANATVVGFGAVAGTDGIAPNATTDAHTTTEEEHRVILTPAQWKIRRSDPPIYITYNFDLGLDLSKSRITHPSCAQITCKGLVKYHTGCDSLCLSGTWNQVDVLLRTALLGYNCALESLDGSFNDLAAILDTHIVNRIPAHTAESRTHDAGGSQQYNSPRSIDVLEYYRVVIEEGLSEIAKVLPAKQTDTASRFSNNGTRLTHMLETWKIGVYTLSTQLTTMVTIIQAAERRLILCAEGVV